MSSSAPAGYAKVAHLMSVHPEFAIYRRYSRLNAQNILYLQAEIDHLELELQLIAEEDAKNSKRAEYPHDWHSLSHGADPGDTQQWDKILEIRHKLEQYNNALIQSSHVLQMQGPASHDLRFLRDWLERDTMGDFPIWGRNGDSWSEAHQHDLVALKPRKEREPITRWFMKTIIPAFNQIVGWKMREATSTSLGKGIYHYNDKSLRLITRTFSTVVASCLPLCSVIVLYLVKSNELRLGIIVLLSALFSLALALLTNARIIEIFAATSAFAAVNVVYLTNGAPGPDE